MSQNGIPSIADEIRRNLRFLTWAMIILYIVVISVSTYGWYENKVQSDRATGALCALRQDLERRVASAEDFLTRNPNGIPGISASLLSQNIAGQQRTIVALSVVHCPAPAP